VRVASSARTASWLRSLPDLLEPVGQQAVGFPVDGDGRRLVGGLDQAEDLAGRLVEPVVPVVDAVFVLDLEVPGVRGRDGLGGQPGNVVMGIDGERYGGAPLRSLCQRTRP
jgi:hypothetical protein